MKKIKTNIYLKNLRRLMDDKSKKYDLENRKTVTIHFISDTHTRHQEISLKGGDILVHCGDFMTSGDDIYELISFLDWFEKQEYKHKIFIAGNHEKIFHSSPEIIKLVLTEYPDIVYLEDSSIRLDNINFYGTPWTPKFGSWAFMLDDNLHGEEIFSRIPKKTDVLISHGPAFGSLDIAKGEVKHLGSEALAARVKKVKPKIHACGHIHSGAGIIEDYSNGNLKINASNLNENYMYEYEPIEVEFVR